jgi:hypothetical protein
VYLHGIGVIGPGLTGWPACRDVLRGCAPWTEQPLAIPASKLLPATERRRCNETTRIVMGAAEEALMDTGGTGIEPAAVATVFASADGDGAIMHRMCASFAAPEPGVSPTLFHNSVHNAPAGYWSIAARSMRPSISLAADQESFAVGLLEAALQAVLDPAPVLLVAFDLPMPHPLKLMRARDHGFAAALLISRERHGLPIATIEIDLEPGAASSPLPVDLAALADNPAARALILLAALATGSTDTVRLGAIGATGAHQLGARCKC